MSSLILPGFYFSLFITTIQLYNCQLINVIPLNQFERDNEAASLCLSNHQNMFLFSSSIQSNGCSILCSFLASSSIKYINYYDAIEAISHNLPEKTPCNNDSYCLSNACTHRDDFPGLAKLFIMDGYFHGKDKWTQTDTYIKVYFESSLSGFKYIDRTRIIYNNDKPAFFAEFTTTISSAEGHFILGIFDHDSDSSDDLIARIKIKFKACPKGTVCIEMIDEVYYLRYTEEWIPSNFI